MLVYYRRANILMLLLCLYLYRQVANMWIGICVPCICAGVAGRDPTSSMVSHRCVLDLNARNLYDFP